MTERHRIYSTQLSADGQELGSLADALREARARPRTRTLLERALDDAIRSRSLIAEEQAKFDTLIDAATDDTWRDYLCYQRDLVEWQLTRAADSAIRRKAYWATIRTPEDWEAEKTKCAKDKHHFFRQWLWTLDPRPDSPLSVIPFDPFPFQDLKIDWLDRLVFTERRGGVEEKSRDMGATWVNCGWAIHAWLYVPYFQALFTSYKEELVDNKKSPKTIFEKLRMLVQYLPPELAPVGFAERQHATFMNLTNPENGSVIEGTAPTMQLGRAGRFSVIFADEFAHFAFGGNPQYTAMSQSTRSIIATSTANGKQNRFYKLRSSKDTIVLTLLWSEHPWKDARWRAGEPVARGMTPADVAQEIDLDYEASETGQRLKEFDELVHVITMSEFARFFGDVAYEQLPNGTRGRPRIPAQGTIGQGLDWGETPQHPSTSVHVWRPSKRMPLSECLFVFREIVRPVWPTLPADWKPPTARRMANEFFAAEQPHNEAQQVVIRLMSPEKLDERLCFHGDPNATDPMPEHLRYQFAGWRARDDYGYPQLQQALQVDWERPSPFRCYPADYGEDGSVSAELRGRPLPGYTQIYFVVADGQGEVFASHTTELKVQPAVDERGLIRGRAEIPAKKKTVDAAGDERATDKKIFDDFIDALRGILSQFGPWVEGLTAPERAHVALAAKNQHLTMEDLMGLDPVAQGAALATFQFALAEETAKAESAEAPIVSFRFQTYED